MSRKRHSTSHHPGAEERGRLAVIPLLLKHIEEKQHTGIRQEEEEISMTAGSNLLFTIWKLVPLSTAHSFNLSSFICSILPILSSPTLSISCFPLPWPYYLCSSTSCEPLTTAQFHCLETLRCSSLTACLALCVAWCPAALGKVCVPGWIPGCVVLISPEWSLHPY